MAMSEKGVCKGKCRIRTYHRWNLCNCSKDEPQDTLTNCVNGLRVSQPRERQLSHLFPKEACNTKCTASVAAPT